MAENHALIPEKVAMYTKTDVEVKDISKNLMSGDFERQYQNGLVDRRQTRRLNWLAALGATVLALLVFWLAVLTVVREIQLSQLRRDLDDVTGNLIALSANVKSLNQKFDANKHYIDFKNSDDAIYTDDDQVNTKLDDSRPAYDSVEKLDGLTVLEDENMGDDNMGDDEDLLDIDEPESGDWYPDYDRRADKTGSNIPLKPAEVADSVIAIKGDSNILEMMRRLNDPEYELRVLQTAAPITSTEHSDSERNKRSVFPDTNLEVDQYAAPRSFTKDERRKTKKVLSGLDSAASKMSMHTVPRTARNSDSVDSRRPFIAAHFHGNTSHLSPEIHEHYKGNGLVRVAHGSVHDVWYPATWTSASREPRPTLTRTGHVHVRHTGVYLVYVQIYYLDSHDVISWVLHRTNPETEGKDTLLQCAQSSHSVEIMDKPNSCFSAAALLLRKGDRLAVRNTGGDRHSLMQPEKSFIGLIQLADAEDPADEL